MDRGECTMSVDGCRLFTIKGWLYFRKDRCWESQWPIVTESSTFVLDIWTCDLTSPSLQCYTAVKSGSSSTVFKVASQLTATVKITLYLVTPKSSVKTCAIVKFKCKMLIVKDILCEQNYKIVIDNCEICAALSKRLWVKMWGY